MEGNALNNGLDRYRRRVYYIGTDASRTDKENLMEGAPLALLFSRRAVTIAAESARPWAPVVPDRAPHPPRARRGRRALASTLRRVADAVAPAPAGDICSPAH